jgi:hypothetical protein
LCRVGDDEIGLFRCPAEFGLTSTCPQPATERFWKEAGSFTPAHQLECPDTRFITEQTGSSHPQLSFDTRGSGEQMLTSERFVA